MKALSQCPLCRGILDRGRRLANTQIKGRYQMELHAFAQEASSPLCSHRCHGSLSQPLWRLLTILCVLSLTAALLRALRRILFLPFH